MRGPGYRAVIAAFALMASIGTAMAHGDGAPQPVDTKGLPEVGADWVPVNPYRGNAKAVEIGASGYNSNCARCHGLDVKSGGLAPDLRGLDSSPESDGWFLTRIRGGARVADRVKMPPFEGLLSQEAMWAIRTYIESQREKLGPP